MSQIEVVRGTATVRLDAFDRTSGTGRPVPLYQPDDLIQATAQALRAVEDPRADTLEDLVRPS